jgi:hypothetical protein
MGYRLPYGQKRHQNVPSTQKADAEFLMELQSALWVAHYTHNGVLRGTLYNLGAATANNVSQQTTYEIVAANGNTLTLRGRDPRLLISPLSITNPNWPMEAPIEMKPDDVTDAEWHGDPPPATNGKKYARLISSGIFHALPLGSAIEFAYPSIIYDKCQPYVKKVILPDGMPDGMPDDVENVTFEIVCSSDVSHARKPYDKAFPPFQNKYYCTLYYYSVSPEAWANYQTPQETWYTRHTVTITKAELDAVSGLIPLKNTAGHNTRVLHPSMASISVAYKIQDNPLLIPYPVDDTCLNVTQSGNNFISTIDLSALTLIDNITEVTISYCPEAVPTDEWIIPYSKTCANDQVDYTGSYVHANGRRCTNIDCQKFRHGDYQAGNCWMTEDADHFALGDEQGNFPASDAGDSKYISRLWHRTSLILEQGMPGSSSHRNFAYRRPPEGGPSLIEIMGSYYHDVPGGFFARREPVHPPSLGQRREWTEDGNKCHEIIYGAYEARTYGVNDNGDIFDKGFNGHFATYLDGWTTRNGYRDTSLSSTQNKFSRYGSSANGLYTYDLSGNGMMMPKRLSDAINQVYSTGNIPTLVHGAKNTEIQSVI